MLITVCGDTDKEGELPCATGCWGLLEVVGFFLDESSTAQDYASIWRLVWDIGA